MKIVSVNQMRELDNRAISDFGISGETLMDNAGRGVAEVVEEIVRVSGYSNVIIDMIAGRGNNGGDVFAAARYLKMSGFNVEVSLICGESEIKGDALAHLNLMKAVDISPVERSEEKAWSVIASRSVYSAPRVVVDGILGTGSSGPARGVARTAVKYVNCLGDRHIVVAVDVPSGLDADNGDSHGNAVKADLTVTMGLPKRGLVEPRALDFVGNLEVVDIGLPQALIEGVLCQMDLITAADLRVLFSRRSRDSHKGTYGHVMIIGGSAGYSGAVAMAAKAAVKSGAGLVSALVPAGIVSIVACIVPEAMVHRGSETKVGSLRSDCLLEMEHDLNDFNAVLVGPGMRATEDSFNIIRELLQCANVPVILDADALNVLAGHMDVLKNASCPVVITPHPGEMARLFGCSVADVQTDRVKWVVDAAERTDAVVVLKGAGTLIAQKGRAPSINMTGNPGMASGGMGDVLGGTIVGMLAQGLSPFDAASAGVYIHGLAGDYAAIRGSQAGMTACDVIGELPSAMRKVMCR